MIQENYKYKYDKDKRLIEHFNKLDNNNKEKRNQSTMQALNDGYKQSEIVRNLEISASAVSKIREKFL